MRRDGEVRWREIWTDWSRFNAVAFYCSLIGMLGDLWIIFGSSESGILI